MTAVDLMRGLQISELNPSEKQHEIYVLWEIFQSGKPKGRVFHT